MSIGAGLSAWIQAHNATPLYTDEYGVGTPWEFSSVPILIADANGVTTRTVVSWDHKLNKVIPPGEGNPPTSTPIPAPVTMYDSTSAADIPADAQVVAGYVDGAYAWSGLPTVPSGDWARFPNAKRIAISVNGGSLADFWDCEPGNFTPDQAAQQVRANMGTGVYCSLSQADAVVQAMAGYAIPEADRLLWIADWNGKPHMPSVAGATVLACQYADPVTSGGHYDLSLVTAEFLARF